MIIKANIKILLIGTAISALLHSGCASSGDISNNIFTVKKARCYPEKSKII